jgi:hypothetical protein
MVKLIRSPLPAGVTIQKEEDYRGGIVFDLLARDCYYKCYICEDKPTAINVEHHKPHLNDPALKYAWDNLFLSCWHCNNIKHTFSDKTINPNLCDPEEHIAITLLSGNNGKKYVEIKELTQDDATSNTAKLLNLVFNKPPTSMKSIETLNLFKYRLVPTIDCFIILMKSYLADPDPEIFDIISHEIHRSAPFAAFKRKLIQGKHNIIKNI